MAKDKKQTAQEFLANVLSKVAEDKRAGVLEVLSAHPEALDVLAEGVLSRSDYSRYMNVAKQQLDTELGKVREYKSRLDTFASESQDLIRLGQKAKADGTTLDDDEADPNTRRSTVDTSKFVNREEATQTFRAFEEGQVKLTSMLTTIGLKHMREFDEILDIEGLIQHADDKKLRVDLAYDDLVRDRRETARNKSIDDRLAKARLEGEQAGEQKALARIGTADHPEFGRLVGPSTLDGLSLTDEQKSGIGLDAALRTFHQESAKGA